jgi:hypothetical protein
MLAVVSVTKFAAMKARKATFVTAGLLSGDKAVNPPIRIPIEERFAKLQIAKVAICPDLSCY